MCTVGDRTRSAALPPQPHATNNSAFNTVGLGAKQHRQRRANTAEDCADRHRNGKPQMPAGRKMGNDWCCQPAKDCSLVVNEAGRRGPHLGRKSFGERLLSDSGVVRLGWVRPLPFWYPGLTHEKPKVDYDLGSSSCESSSALRSSRCQTDDRHCRAGSATRAISCVSPAIVSRGVATLSRLALFPTLELPEQIVFLPIGCGFSG